MTGLFTLSIEIVVADLDAIGPTRRRQYNRIVTLRENDILSRRILPEEMALAPGSDKMVRVPGGARLTPLSGEMTSMYSQAANKI